MRMRFGGIPDWGVTLFGNLQICARFSVGLVCMCIDVDRVV